MCAVAPKCLNRDEVEKSTSARGAKAEVVDSVESTRAKRTLEIFTCGFIR